MLHKSPETTIATASNLCISSSSTSNTESASIASNVISLSNFNDDPFAGIFETPDDQGQNRADLNNLVLMFERFHISDRARAVLANAVLKNYGIIDQQGTAFVIDRSKL